MIRSSSWNYFNNLLWTNLHRMKIHCELCMHIYLDNEDGPKGCSVDSCLSVNEYQTFGRWERERESGELSLPLKIATSIFLFISQFWNRNHNRAEWKRHFEEFEFKSLCWPMPKYKPVLFLSFAVQHQLVCSALLSYVYVRWEMDICLHAGTWAIRFCMCEMEKWTK